MMIGAQRALLIHSGIVMKLLQATVTAICFLFAAHGIHAQDATNITTASLAKLDSLSSTLKPATRAWVVEQGAKARAMNGNAAAVEASLRSAINNRFASNKLSNADVQTLLSLVTRESLKSAQREKQIAQQKLKALNEASARISDVRKMLASASNALASGDSTAPCTSPSCASFKLRIDSVVALQRASGITTTPLAAIRTTGDLRQRVRQLEKTITDIRNERQQTELGVQGFERKEKEIMPLLSNFLKTLMEVRRAEAPSQAGF
jgi:hypothetical protein